MGTCTTEYFAGQGKVYVAPRAKAGAINGGWTELGDTSRLEITTNQTFNDIYESCSGTRSIVAHYVTQTDWAFAVDAKSFSKENIARALYGTASAVTGATAPTETLTVYGLNQIAPLKHPGVSAVTVKDGVTTLTVNTDYTIDAANGTITLISAANLTGPAPYSIEVDYTYAAYDKVETNTTTGGEYAFRFEGINMTTGKTVIAEINRVALDLAGALSLISADGTEQVFTMEGMILADTTQPSGESQYVTIKKAQ